MNRKILATGYAIKDGKAIINTQIEESLTEAELKANIAQVEKQQIEIKQQMLTLKARYFDLEAAKEKYTELAEQLTPELPSIN